MVRCVAIRYGVLARPNDRLTSTSSTYSQPPWSLTSTPPHDPETRDGKHIGHKGLCAWTRGMQALIAYWSGCPLDATRLAHEAQEYAPLGTALVRLRCIEARAWSHLGDASQTVRAITAAHVAREQASGVDDLHDAIGGEFTFDEARQGRCNGSAYVELGAAEPAITETRRAIELLGKMPPDRRSGKVEAEAYADLSAAYLLENEFDGAREALAPVLVLPPELRIEGLTQRLERVRSMVVRSPFRRSREARQLREQIEAFTDDAVSRMLPSGPSSLAPS